jgi:thioesterase domain-containing protein
MLEIHDTTTLERHILATIPLARAMDLRVVDYDGHRIALAAPLGPNVNDKGCAFGGSLASLATLAGWGLICLKLAEGGIAAEVYVQDSTIVYLAPVWDEIVAEAAAAQDESWDRFLDAMRDRGKARIAIDAELAAAEGGSVPARVTARFVAKRVDP